MILQAHEYQESMGKNLGEFFQSVRGRFKTQTGLRMAEEIERRRKRRGV